MQLATTGDILVIDELRRLKTCESHVQMQQLVSEARAWVR